ncbi:MAG: Gfo/Idh/MocA family oxidoreductase [Bryobacteraceae bacterium]|nr:Gfo/Idh/MocA family oxidoreductase [Bryobacteraceae bacterium]
MSDHPTRRAALAGSAGLLLVKPETAFGSQANSAVPFGIIGTGGRGVYVGTHMANDKNARLAAICDLYPDRIDQAKTRIPGADKVKATKDLNELLAMKDIDAVLIATPVYLHPVHFEAAVKAKKHIYCEKPAGADVAGVKRLLKAGLAADPRTTIQFGFQQRFSPEYIKGLNYLKTGALGEMKLMMSYWILGGPPPTTFDAKYQGEEAKIRYWGRFMETSGGPIVEQDCHGIDTLNQFAGDQHPLKAVGTGGLRYPVPYGDWSTDHQNITFFYPGGLEGYLMSIKHVAGFRSVKEQFFGSKAMLELARTYLKLHGPIPTSPLKNADDLEDRSLMEKVDSKREITIDAIESFFQSIIDKRPYNMTKTSAESTLTAIMGRMAVELKREVTWEETMKAG